MTREPAAPTPTAAKLWTGRAVTALTALFLAFDSAGKILALDAVAKASESLGLPASATVPIGLLLAACTVLHLVPGTAVLGAVLLTGYLGGAVAIHVRAGNGVFPVAFTLAVGALVWVGLLLRRPALRELLLPRAGVGRARAAATLEARA